MRKSDNSGGIFISCVELDDRGGSLISAYPPGHCPELWFNLSISA